MAHKKGVGSTDNGRDSKSKRLGVKLFGGQSAKAGNIIIRQRGTKYHPGENVYMGKDFTIHAKVEGTVSFRKSYRNRMYVSIDPTGTAGGSNANGGSVATAELPIKKATVTKAKKAVKVDAPATEGKSDPDTDAQGIAQVTPPVAETSTPDVDATPGKAATTVKVGGKTFKQDDLKIIEGVGPKIEGILHDMGIKTWQAMADADVDDVKAKLNDAGSQFRIHNPGTWGRQAQLAVDGKWEELEKLQDDLDGGKE